MMRLIWLAPGRAVSTRRRQSTRKFTPSGTAPPHACVLPCECPRPLSIHRDREQAHLMSNSVLVTYASRTGTTAGVAEVIGQTLSERGLDVEIRPMTEVTDLSPYGAVVAGSAIQDHRWLPEAMQFLHTHRAALAERPFAAFLVCMTLSMKNTQYHEGVKAWLEPVRALVRPVSEGYFAGALDIAKVPSWRKRLMFRVSVRLGAWSEGDHRDWDAIRAWAGDLAPKLHA